MLILQWVVRSIAFSGNDSGLKFCGKQWLHMSVMDGDDVIWNVHACEYIMICVVGMFELLCFSLGEVGEEEDERLTLAPWSI